MTRIEIQKEESINGQWKFRVRDKDGSLWNNSLKGEIWAASPEGVQTFEVIRKALDVISRAVAG